MRDLPAGPDAVLLDFAGEPEPLDAVGTAVAALRAAMVTGALRVTEVVPSAQSVLVQARRGSGIDVLGIHRALRAAQSDSGEHDLATGDAVRIPVTYDGPDLDEVATLLGITADEVADIHLTTEWQVQFMGFAPGFGYLVPQDDRDHPFRDLGRRSESRPRVPAGAVAIAAGYSAVYPRVSPGGWHLIGHTTTTMWDEQATPPALLAPGSSVRFDAAGPA
ncbi:5-oxoprolinase subunit B family protein [Gordonia insulae]|uniref:Kinase A inhibitor n=1 Tax=Gordonia insulae TaxID=2420509 RepID=A0A3G8JK91_9ACTN|nr:allophanate hydrolase subunit 1 [Gordonia insulae]AZG45358.1 Kinase A inhibitor [Gordonia insulae]